MGSEEREPNLRSMGSFADGSDEYGKPCDCYGWIGLM